MKESTREVLNALELMGKEVIYGKGGFWIKDEGFITLAQARKMTGVAAPKREKREEIQPYGDYATIFMINGGKLQ